MFVPQFTIYMVGSDKGDAYYNCNHPFDDPDIAQDYVSDNGGELKVFAMTVFGPDSADELEEV